MPEQDYPNLYPIQILLRSGSSVKPKMLMIYFNLKDQYERWSKKLEEATGSYKISDFYKQDTSLYCVLFDSFEHASEAKSNFVGKYMVKPKDQANKKIEEISFPEMEDKTVYISAIHR